ncbi:hypothetical protein ON010_g5896 [Phytophthora cinnamomi]|nr:hypothetical protein ON010_g5896 [Phytophthora cinnamomi]
MLHLPAPLLVTTVNCIELTIAVPSWTDADKEAAHKPLLIHVNELQVQVRNIWECSSKVRREAEERVQAALLEPDPLGSTAAMFAFARDVNDRTKLVVEKLSVHIFVGGISRVEMTLTDLNARTTDALWQDVKDSTPCVDYSPDHLVQTRFKAMSFLLSVGINPAGSGVQSKSGGHMICLISKVSVDVRITRFYHRKELEDSWKRHMQLVDANFGAVKMEFGIADFMEVYMVASTLCNWVLNGRSSESCALSSPEDGMAANRELFGPGQVDHPNIELQITFRGTLEAKLKFTSPTEGPQELFLAADRAAGNVILHRHGVRELQLSMHELAVRFRGYVVLRLKPDREVFHLEQRHNSLSVRWRVQSVLCRIDDDLTMMLAEMYRFVNEKEQAIVLRCGTCHQQISLDMIDVHVCPPRNGSQSLTATPCVDCSSSTDSRRNSCSESSVAENVDTNAAVKSTNGDPKMHVELHMDELDLQTGGKLVQIVLKRFGIRDNDGVVERDITTKLSNLRLTTESNEFAGDAIFVPALPLAFQMLECSLQGCGCILRRKGSIHLNHHGETNRAFNWPARLFLDIAHCAMSAQECFAIVDKIQLRSSFSDGGRVCSSSQPQLSFHITMDKIRCQLDELLFKLAREIFDHVGESLSSSKGSAMMALFLGVLQIRAVEFTLQTGNLKEARAKSLLKQAIVVFDNQLGFLCTQSSLDFKTILNSQTMRFVHRQTPAARITVQSSELPNYDLSGTEEFHTRPSTSESAAVAEPLFTEAGIVTGETGAADDAVAEPPFTDKEDATPSGSMPHEDSEAVVCQEELSTSESPPPAPPNLEREDATRCIQRMVRRKQLVRQQKQRFEPDDYEPGIVTPIHVPTKVPELETGCGDAPAKPSPVYRRESGKSLANLTLVIDAESGSNDSSPSSSSRKVNLGIPSPIMVLGADTDIVGEIRGGITKLMSPLSRARLQSESFRDGLNKLLAPINRTLSPTANTKRRPSIESVAPMVEVACYNATANEQLSPSVKKGQELHQIEPKQSDCNDIANTGDAPENKPVIEQTSASKRDAASVNASSSSKSSESPKVNGLSEAKLAALPDVVRILVQVGECRMCVPINPREKVKFLCQEIVRRFNESFAADRGSISEVSVQDKHGGVFCPSDSVGFMLSVAPSELLFAYPHEHDGPIRSLARLTAGSVRTAPSKASQDPQSHSTNGGAMRTKFSKVPLPLAIALLANESERELIRSGLCERDGGVAAEAWPDLALNAASLDAEKNPLIVEVAWHETCVEVTNCDAFALCRQLLGLCTSRVTWVKFYEAV